jgi:type IV pilus assembly protein PilC
MIFSSRLSLSSLIELCRALRHYLAAGLMLRDAFREQAKLGDAGVRPVAGRIAAELEQGHSLADALQPEAKAFPPILPALVGVGEATGNLPEIFGELERYFVRQQGLRRQFIAAIAWPLIEFLIAILVVAGFILILGMLPQDAYMPNGKRYDPLHLGLFGPSGAATFLAYVAAFLAALYGLYMLITRVLGRGALMSRMLLRVPVLGGCLQAIAVSRFCLALRMTLESAMPIRQALALSMRATGNEAFVAKIPVVQSAVRKGDELSLALAQAHVFPRELLNILTVAESSGRFDEVLEQQTNHYYDVAGRRLVALTFAASALMILFIGCLIVCGVFSIFLTYLDILNQLLQGI